MASAPKSTRKFATILVVEDSATQLEMLRFLLEEAGFSVVSATDGKQGLAAARANPIDLVISDIMMPEMDGYALCKALRADETLRHLPVILLTSLADPLDVIRALESGADNFIGKPYDHGRLLARVQSVLANQELRRVAPRAVSILFAGQRFFIAADRQQILDLLLSTYEDAVDRSGELIRVRDELRLLNGQLEARIGERTAALTEEIEERRRAENALREKAHFLSESQRLGHVGSWLWRMTGPISWSDELYRLYAVSPDTFSPTVESPLGLIHPDDRLRMQAWIAACAAGENPDELEYRINLPNGTIRFLRAHGEAVFDAARGLAHMAGTVQDITRRKRAEAERE